MKKVVVILDNGIITKVYSDDPEVEVEVIDIDSDYVDIEEVDEIYERYKNDNKFVNAYSKVTVPGLYE